MRMGMEPVSQVIMAVMFMVKMMNKVMRMEPVSQVIRAVVFMVKMMMMMMMMATLVRMMMAMILKKRRGVTNAKKMRAFR